MNKLSGKTMLRMTTLLLTGLFSSLASAHAGHDHGGATGFAGGLLHTLSGWDHLIALLGFGLLLAVMPVVRRGRALLLVALALMSGALTGSLAAGMLAGVSLLEQLVLASVLSLPLLIWLTLRRPQWHALALSAMLLFSASHGVVQGIEAEAAPNAALFQLGLICSSVSLVAVAMAVVGWLLSARASVAASTVGN